VEKKEKVLGRGQEPNPKVEKAVENHVGRQATSDVKCLHAVFTELYKV
jgi:hypothetical protein